MSKSKDQAARIALDVYPGNTVTDENDRAALAKCIRNAIKRGKSAAVRKERERCIKCAESEPELPGPMPYEMWKLLSGNRYATQRALVVSVQETKVSIVEAIRKGKA